MRFTEYLDTFTTLESSPVTCFVAPDTPSLFVSLLQKNIRKQTSNTFQLIQPSTPLEPALYSTFLGSSLVYWISSDCEARSFIPVLRNYTGTNQVYCVIKQNDSFQHGRAIELPEKVDRSLFDRMHVLGGAPKESFSKMLFERVPYISLDQAALLLCYESVIGKNGTLFFDEWFNHIVVPETSLFSLCQYFFAKKAHAFFNVWQQVRDYYAPQFWISFFSEQLWRASWYVQYQKARKLADAKKISFRLPFSFINRDWRSYKSDALVQALDQLYSVDYKLKNGAHEYELELFFSTFFTRRNI